MDRAEQIVARAVVARWSEAEQEWLRSLPPTERELVELAAAHFQAMPVEDSDDD